MSSRARLRMSRTALLPVAVLALCALPLAAVGSWWLLVLLVPAVAAAWVLRVGLDLDEAGVTVRSMLGRRTVPWSDLAGIRIAERGDLRLVTTHGTEVRVPVLRARDLPRLAAVSHGRIVVP